MAKDIKKDLAAARLDAENRMREVDFQVDTLSNRTGIGGYFSPDANTLTVNYVEGEDSFNSWSGSMSLLMHEQKHRDNQALGMFAYALSPELAYKTEMNDEISANMASLVCLRDKYLKTGDISVFEEDASRFRFYTDALKRGEINPFSNKKEDFDKEMALIANGTRDMWMRNFATTETYLDAGVDSAKFYGEKDGKHAAYYDQNYEQARKIAYTIGGVDFSQYMDKDVEIPDAGKRRIMGSEKLAEELGLPKYDGKMSLLQYQNLLQHALAVQDNGCGLKCMNLFPGNDDLTIGRFNTDMAAYAYMTTGKLMDHQLENYGDALDKVAKNDKALIDGLVNQVARDYAERGEKLPEGDDEAYNKAVNELYSGEVKFDQADLKYEGKVNLRQAFNPKDELPLKELPKEAAELQQKVEDMGWWNRGFRQYASFFGFGDFAENVEKLPAVARYPLQTVEYFSIPLAAGIRKCGEWGSAAVDAVKGWFGNDADKNKDENKPVRPVNKDKQPEYREWSPEDRVSDVQKKEVLNLMADVIRKPGERGFPDEVSARRAASGQSAEAASTQRQALKGDMQKAAQDKARMMKVIEGMNRINGARNSLDVNGTVDTLYGKFGDNAYDLLAKAVNEPYNFAQSVGDTSITTSRAAVKALCEVDENNKAAIVKAVLQNRGR